MDHPNRYISDGIRGIPRLFARMFRALHFSRNRIPVFIPTESVDLTVDILLLL